MANMQALSHKTHLSTNVSNGLALLLVALSVICGLFSFVLCLAAEGSRTEATWYIMSDQGHGSAASVCTYDASGRRPLAFAVGAFLSLVVAMFAEHAYLLVVITSRPPPASAPQTPPLEIADVQCRLRTHKLWARNLYLMAWICFAIAEALLLIAMAVESSHLCQWAKPRSSCRVIRPGLFAAAGVFGSLTVLLGIALYVTASSTQKLRQTLQGMLMAFPSAPPLPI
uniref:Uncharacterized protein LOC105032822 n=1 Tax=Elaeis guineensis var. tenera TaxID=51953 RepID=A0A6I9QAF3_ELAGV|nr:uncharacterized protein LOC105032822 [Elaeis guineensis]